MANENSGLIAFIIIGLIIFFIALKFAPKFRQEPFDRIQPILYTFNSSIYPV
jgi:hypothetical protein